MPAGEGLPLGVPDMSLHQEGQCIIPQVSPQTGICVSELCALTMDDSDFEQRLLVFASWTRMRTCTIEQEKTEALAVKRYLAVRSKSLSHPLFLNYHAD